MTRAWLLLVGLVIVWGSHWVVVKVGLETIPPFTYGVLRLLGGIVVLAALMAARGPAQASAAQPTGPSSSRTACWRWAWASP